LVPFTPQTAFAGVIFSRFTVVAALLRPRGHLNPCGLSGAGRPLRSLRSSFFLRFALSIAGRRLPRRPPFNVPPERFHPCVRRVSLRMLYRRGLCSNCLYARSAPKRPRCPSCVSTFFTSRPFGSSFRIQTALSHPTASSFQVVSRGFSSFFWEPFDGFLGPVAPVPWVIPVFLLQL